MSKGRFRLVYETEARGYRMPAMSAEAAERFDPIAFRAMLEEMGRILGRYKGRQLGLFEEVNGGETSRYER